MHQAGFGGFLQVGFELVEQVGNGRFIGQVAGDVDYARFFDGGAGNIDDAKAFLHEEAGGGKASGGAGSGDDGQFHAQHGMNSFMGSNTRQLV